MKVWVVGLRAPAFNLPMQHRSNLTEWNYELVLDIQLSHQIVNVLFTITDWNRELTVLWGSWLSKTINTYFVSNKLRHRRLPWQSGGLRIRCQGWGPFRSWGLEVEGYGSWDWGRLGQLLPDSLSSFSTVKLANAAPLCRTKAKTSFIAHIHKVSGLGFWFSVFGCHFSGFGFRISGSGFRVEGFYLTECIYQLVLERQLPHKIVNLLFSITN